MNQLTFHNRQIKLYNSRTIIHILKLRCSDPSGRNTHAIKEAPYLVLDRAYLKYMCRVKYDTPTVHEQLPVFRSISLVIIKY